MKPEIVFFRQKNFTIVDMVESTVHNTSALNKFVGLALCSSGKLIVTVTFDAKEPNAMLLDVFLHVWRRDLVERTGQSEILLENTMSFVLAVRNGTRTHNVSCICLLDYQNAYGGSIGVSMVQLLGDET